MPKLRNYIVGIDGCKFGWIAIALDLDGQFQISKHSTFNDLINTYSQAKRYLVDMAIGLSGLHHPRIVEKLAREKLKPNKTSTIFTPPCRTAVYEQSYDSAKEKNITITGKSISIQAWNIVPKIREVDQFLIKNRKYQDKIWEAHPEVCLAGLNGGIPMLTKKKTVEGKEERLNLLQNIFQGSKEIFEAGDLLFLKKEVKTDDLVDALALAISGFLGEKKSFDFLKSDNFPKDEKGLEMKMVYFKIKKATLE